MPNKLDTFERDIIIEKINLLIDNLVSIEDKTGKFLLKLKDGRIIDTKGWNGWEWTHGIGLYGIYKYYELSNDKKSLDIIKKWFNDRFREGTTTKNVNTVAPFLTLAYLYEREKNQIYLSYLEEWMNWVMYEMPRTEEKAIQHTTYANDHRTEIWDDTLMMSVMPLAKSGKVLGKSEYIEEAKKQFLVHIKYLTDKKTGLWFHGWSFEKKSNFAEALWGRGNSWITIAIPDFLELTNLDENDPIGKALLDSLRAQVDALSKYQDESGLWHTLINDETSYLEASATAGFAYGILKAVRKLYIDKKYEEVANRAIKGILDNINSDGELRNVSFGTGVFNELEGYKKVECTSMPYGQSMAILCLSELLYRFI